LYNITDEYFEIYDHYTNRFKKYDISYKFGSAMRWSLTLKTMPENLNKANLKNDTLVQLVEGLGGFGLYTQNKLYVDSLDKILASWLVRTKGELTGKVATLTQAQWDTYEQYNLKNERLG
jgi:hypothetical protein